jgi:EPS-associated MarR family transcriptional regulator
MPSVQLLNTSRHADAPIPEQDAALTRARPEINQRELAHELGIGLRKANCCLQSLMEKWLVKANNFKNNNKKAYMYFLTPKGIAEKARATTRFLARKVAEYEALQREIELLLCESRKS